MGDSKFPGEKGGGKKSAAVPSRAAKGKSFVPLAAVPEVAAPVSPATGAMMSAPIPVVPTSVDIVEPLAATAPTVDTQPEPFVSAKAVTSEVPAMKAAPAAQETPVAASAAVVPEAAPFKDSATTRKPAVLASDSKEITTPPNPVAAVSPAPALSRGIIEMATTFDAPTTPAAATEKVKAMFGGLNDRAKTAMEKSTKMGEEITELTKGNVEALVASGKVAAKGAETMAQDAAEYSKKSFETMTSMFKSMASVKSPTELFQLQSEFAKSSFDSAVAEASKLSEAWVKLAGEIVQPISNRYAVASEKLKSAAL